MATGESGKSITCPSCGGTTDIRAAGYTVTLVCQYCSSVLDIANPDVRIITEFSEAAAELPIPLGTRGVLKDVEWEVIGFLQRGDGYAVWDEYLLFNPYQGYRWLIDTGRGWSFGTMLTTAPWRSGTYSAIYGDETYSAFFTGNTAKVLYVLGEFYWRVAVGEEVIASDYVNVPHMLSLEQSGSEINWTLSEWIEPKVITAAFGVPASTGWPPLPHQPSPYGKSLWTMGLIGAAAFFWMLILPILLGGSGPQTEQSFTLKMNQTEQATPVPPSPTMDIPSVLQPHLSLEANPKIEEQTIPIGTVTVTRAYQAVSVVARADSLNNAWVDLDYSLVNRATQQSIDASAVVEYYTGRDAEGDWSEGDRSATSKFASVPRGTYDLVVDASAHKWGGSSFGSFSASGSPDENVQVSISAAPGGTFYSNLFWLTLLLFAPLIFVVWRHAAFEKARMGERDGADEESWDDDDD